MSQCLKLTQLGNNLKRNTHYVFLGGNFMAGRFFANTMGTLGRQALRTMPNTSGTIGRNTVKVVNKAAKQSFLGPIQPPLTQNSFSIVRSPLLEQLSKVTVRALEKAAPSGVKVAGTIFAGTAMALTAKEATNFLLDTHKAQPLTEAEKARKPLVQVQVVDQFKVLANQISNKEFEAMGLSANPTEDEIDTTVRQQFGTIVDNALLDPQLQNSAMLHVLSTANKVAAVSFPGSGAAATLNIATWLSNPSIVDLFTVGSENVTLKDIALVFSSQVELPNGTPTETKAHRDGADNFPSIFHQVAVQAPPEMRGLLAVIAFMFKTDATPASL